MSAARPTFSYLSRLVDQRGIWQHAIGTCPDPVHGYCLDDAARAAMVVAALRHDDRRWTAPLVTCCRFIDATLAERGGARNFMDAGGVWLDAPHPGDHVGRAVWALGVLSASTDEALASWASGLLARTVATSSGQEPISLHTRAYALLGMAAAHDAEVIRTAGRAHLDWVRERLPGAADWPWPEPSVRYDAGRIPQALIVAGQRLGDRRAVADGLRLLDWLTSSIAPRHRRHHRYPGCWGLPPGVEIDDTGDEQPLEAAAFAAAHAAAGTVRGSSTHATYILGALEWFHGANRLALPLVDDDAGACHDGLGRCTRNDNCGAESTLAYAETWLHAMPHVGSPRPVEPRIS